MFLCHDQDRTSTFDDVNENHAPAKLINSKNENCAVYCNLSFAEDSQSPKIIMKIKIDKEFHVQLKCNGCRIPLPHSLFNEKFLN